jgi:hypothetical protein
MFEPRVETVKSVEWNGESNVKFEFEGGCFWEGAKRKDFWDPERNWESIIKPGAKLRTWNVQWSRVIGFEIFDTDKEKWVSVWCCANEFQTKAERKKSDKAYSDFIEKDGKLIAKLIDMGLPLAKIDKKISKGHTGNTYGCALAIGIRDAKNRKAAEAIREQHNDKYGVPKNKRGVVNPALVTIEVK